MSLPKSCKAANAIRSVLNLPIEKVAQIAEQNPILQSSANGGIISTGDEIYDVSGRNVESAQRSSGKSKIINTRAEINSRGNKEETKESFVRRITQANERDSRGRLLTLKGNSGKETLIGYIIKDTDNTEANRAVEMLRKKGYDVDYCDGPIEINSNGITRLSNNAITTNDGKIIVSSNNQGPAEQTADHEEVHLLQNLDNEAFVEYESVFCANIIIDNGAFLKIAQKINKDHFCVEERKNEKTGEIERIGKYSDEELMTIKVIPKIFKELIAYLRQCYNFDSDLAMQEYGVLFENWDEVAKAIEKFNEAVGANTKADSNSEPASFMPQNPILQSNANGGIIDSVGDNDVDERTNFESVQTIREKYFKTEKARPSTPETAEAFAERTRGDSIEGSGKARSLLTMGNSKLSIAFTPATQDNSFKHSFVKKLKSHGIEAYYCDGIIETNVDGKTMIHEQALTTSDGKIFISNNATVQYKSMIDHELVHWTLRTLQDAYFDYEDTVLRNLNRDSNYYIAFCEELNEREYDNKYDTDSVEGALSFNSEIAAYVYQYVLNDKAFADEFFSKMFDNWEAVVNAVYTFNSQMKIDTSELTQADSNSEPASFMPENEAQGGFGGEVQTDAANGENKPLTQQERNLQAMLGVVTGQNTQNSQLQSSANGGIIDSVGDNNVISDGRTVTPSVE